MRDGSSVSAMLVVLALKCALCHMPEFKDHDDCSLETRTSTQSLAIYMTIPGGSTAKCSFKIPNMEEELQISVNMPMSYYTKALAGNLSFSIYAKERESWKPECKAGWTGWHSVKGSDVSRVQLQESVIHESRRNVTFEPWGIGAYIPIMGCSTKITHINTQHIVTVGNANQEDVRVCIGSGMKEDKFKWPYLLQTSIALKYTASIIRTWRWGLQDLQFYFVISCAAVVNSLLMVLFVRSTRDVRKNRSDILLSSTFFIVKFWISGVIVAWSVVAALFLRDRNLIGDGKEYDGPKLFTWDKLQGALLYYHTLPVLFIFCLCVLVRDTFFWHFVLDKLRGGKRIVIALLLLDLFFAAFFDILFPFSYLSIVPLLFCAGFYFSMFIKGEEFNPGIEKVNDLSNGHDGPDIRENTDLNLKTTQQRASSPYTKLSLGSIRNRTWLL